MKKLIALTAALVAFAGSAQAGNADFVIVNKTGYDINEIYVSPSSKANWGTDRLGETMLQNNRQRNIKLGEVRDRDCEQDIQAVFTDGDEVQWEEINLCILKKVTLKYNRKTNTVSADIENY